MQPTYTQAHSYLQANPSRSLNDFVESSYRSGRSTSKKKTAIMFLKFTCDIETEDDFRKLVKPYVKRTVKCDSPEHEFASAVVERYKVDEKSDLWYALLAVLPSLYEKVEEFYPEIIKTGKFPRMCTTRSSRHVVIIFTQPQPLAKATNSLSFFSSFSSFSSFTFSLSFSSILSVSLCTFLSPVVDVGLVFIILPLRLSPSSTLSFPLIALTYL